MVMSDADMAVAKETGALYAFIWDNFEQSQWQKFSDDHFLAWSPIPGMDVLFRDKVVLDAGCGSGRACRSMLLQGAKKVFAIDMGEGCIRNTTTRNANFGDRLEAKLASVTDIPFPDNTFDVVHCDGVLHHTTAPRKGFSELVRVLKPGGVIVMAVYGRGGLMNWAIYFSRWFRKIIPMTWTFEIAKRISDDPVFLYSILDCMYVPIRENYYADEIRAWFEEEKLTQITRLDSTWGPYAYGPWMKGEGYIKFVGVKPAP
jgi:SAM-dependent methyltransferase